MSVSLIWFQANDKTQCEKKFCQARSSESIAWDAEADFGRFLRFHRCTRLAWWHGGVPLLSEVGGFWCEMFFSCISSSRPVRSRLRSSFRPWHLGLAAACQAQASDTKCQPSSDLTIGRCRLDCNRSYTILLRPWGIPHQNFHGWNLKWWFPTAFSSFWAAMFLLEAQHFL